jgi:predicted nucleotidyltransferase
MNKLISENIDELKKLCKSHDIKRMYAFGSVVNKKFSDNSDIDFLISFDDDLSFDEYTDNYFELHYKLKDLFSRNIDLITEKSLSNPYFIESINKNKKLLYESKK